jgi:hypothetical protein
VPAKLIALGVIDHLTISTIQNMPCWKMPVQTGICHTICLGPQNTTAA